MKIDKDMGSILGPELKIDGDPKWHCPMKFDFFY